MSGKRLALLFWFAALLLSSLPSQVLADQFGAETDLGALSGKGNLLLLWSDLRDAGEQLEGWKGLLEQSAFPLEPSRIVAVADLAALPFFVPRFSVIASLKKDFPKLPLLLDWKGELRGRWSLPREGVAVLVLGPGGLVRTRVLGPADPAALQGLRSALRP